jgi:hypothetical protein
MTRNAAPPPTRLPWGYVGAASAVALAAGTLAMLHFWGGTPPADARPPREEKPPVKGPATKAVPFDGKRAMKYLEAVCKIGPRMAGTDNMRRQQRLMEKHFADLGGKVSYQKFTSKQRGRRSVEMANMVVAWRPEKTTRVILCSHYDTRPVADQEPDPRDWRKPFISANDGGSGVAFMMELAHHMKGMDLEVGVDFVFFDGEEYVFGPDEDMDNYFQGSRQFAREYNKDRKRKYEYRAAILLDMIAGADARLPKERNSVILAGKLVEEVWGIAEEMECKVFKKGLSKVAVSDDHIPLNEGRIPAIDLIDFD